MTNKVKVAVIGSGNIGMDLTMKILRHSQRLEMAALVGIDPKSDGLMRAGRMGIATTADGLEGLRRMPVYRDIEIVFDATSAKSHEAHAKVLKQDGKTAIDLTPAAVGPYVVPSVNLDRQIDSDNVNMVTCGGQATIPIVAAISRVAPVIYAEIVASLASKSAGPGTRANIDEFTETTSRALEIVGGAQRGKAIIILNPAEPPLMMRDTVFCLTQGDDRQAIERSIATMIAAVQAYVPGYRLKQAVQFETISPEAPIRLPGSSESVSGLKVTVFLEVEGAAHYLPAYAGNLDIMTSAALRTAERMAERQTKAA
ncbi:acetaldehyde dehydrogenase (acetylating) [Telmatospirillum sp.]|uniref:acetaldehyde dehydrogenase (acetylating) n=1 Tax=Telmatospirillum sp. TaxID=2079197 RepID=UPI002842278F|nr:acetaldehyde dehydrogenase (acetylating) [Telmatospirillum sp.]MDR3435600.1 acetaldehyde dehydrogenase (acetylating) [Telmatospirillum sp.]